jgi:hypothetical protein
MQASDLRFSNLDATVLKGYEDRGPDLSKRFLKWFLENVFRLEPQDADDTVIDSKQDKGIDGILVDRTTETIYLFQSKTRESDKASLGDTDLKEFVGSLEQFKTPETIEGILNSNANALLKAAITRNELKDKVASGFSLEGIFITHIAANDDAHHFMHSAPSNVVLYDAERIAEEYVEISAPAGITDSFYFDIISDLLRYDIGNVRARLFLADALQLTHLSGILDGSLFARNVRYSLGHNTKINKSLIANIRDKAEHKNFPLYHNGITIVCEKLLQDDGSKLGIKNYVVVNGAQSLSSLYRTKAKITKDLKILVRVVEVNKDEVLEEKITTNSNNQNAIKARDQRSNSKTQLRLKKEVESIKEPHYQYEIKRGEARADNPVIVNEEAGLVLLAMDLEQPWSCHQRYKVMDELHSDIFGRPSIDGWQLVGFYRLFEDVRAHIDQLEDKIFGSYTLTKYFLAYAVAEILRDGALGRAALSSFRKLIETNRLDDFVGIASGIAKTTAQDLNAEILPELAKPEFDYKAQLKSPTWCKAVGAKLVAQYRKDVARKKAESIDALLSGLGL